MLDKFTHCLLVKCSSEMLDTLLTTLIKQLQGAAGDQEAAADVKVVARRFVRSVIRVFVVFNIELSPSQSKKKSLQATAQPMQRCKRVFQALINIAIEELCETANALLAPVRYGVARPTSGFAAPAGGSTSSSSSAELVAIEELFSAEPMAPRAVATAATAASSSNSRPQQLQQQLSASGGHGGGDARRSRNNSVGDQNSGLARNRG